jgi:hypothetical protein
MAQVDSENTTGMPVVSTRRRFLSQAAGVAAGGTVLALATVRPSMAATAPASPLNAANVSPALSAAARALDDAGDAWKAAKAAYVAEDQKACEWQEANPVPKDPRARKRYWARWRKDRDPGLRAKFDALLAAEHAFADALVAVALVEPRDMTELALKACLGCVYEEGDFLELLCGHAAPIARSVAFRVIQMLPAFNRESTAGADV